MVRRVIGEQLLPPGIWMVKYFPYPLMAIGCCLPDTGDEENIINQLMGSSVR